MVKEKQKEPNKRTKGMILDERDRLNRDYWTLKIKTEAQYRKAKKERDLYAGMKCKLSKMSAAIMELIKEYEE